MGAEPGGARNWRLFELGFRPWLRWALAGIHVEGGADPDPGQTVLLVANHCSWYDGFLLREVHRKLGRRGVLRTVMLERELRGRPILRFLGGTGFDPERPQSLRGALRELAAVGERETLTVSFFPQGRIRPSWARPLDFAPGVRLLQRSLSPVVVLPVALHLETGNRVKPSAFISIGSPLPIPAGEEGPDLRTLESRIEERLDRILTHLARHGEDAPGRWPPKVAE
ncbi:MAG: hypothetical protein EA351_06455 [Gemmatimonadales bacterium]|nr:MAG: hypothetical protein EA351_06455 [Gemmatimonadales bacterium]